MIGSEQNQWQNQCHIDVRLSVITTFYWVYYTHGIIIFDNSSKCYNKCKQTKNCWSTYIGINTLFLVDFQHPLIRFQIYQHGSAEMGHCAWMNHLKQVLLNKINY